MTFSSKLLSWYHKNKRDLPWRRTKNPYFIWVSEIMLQQTTVNAVIPYYTKWIKSFPTMQKMAQAPEQTILKQWQGLGYYNRAKNLHKAAKKIMAEYNGKLPDDPNELKKLPGFGPYTVGAVSSIAFGIRYPIIDANVRRVIMRILNLKGFADKSNDGHIFKFLQDNMPSKNISDFNQALMELGALVCKAKSPQCNLCPFQSDCKAFQLGVQEIIPETKKKETKNIDVVVGVIEKDGKIFIQKRTEKGLLNGLWEFPGGKIEKDESPIQALKREIKEELGVKIVGIKPFITVKHYYTQFVVNLHAFKCRTPESLPLDECHLLIHLPKFKHLPMPSGTVKIVNYLENKI